MEEFTFKDFFENVPPGTKVVISDIPQNKHPPGMQINAPQLQLHCGRPSCDGIRFFESRDEYWVSENSTNDHYLTFSCRNCRKSWKTFSLRLTYLKDAGKWQAQKYGELPPFGLPTPSRAMSLIGEERDLFIMGRRCENQGMGIGAFVYYRRVIESQKNRILDELIRVISEISPGDAVLGDIESAKKEVRFTKAVETIKHALPQSLFINGYNPLTLLHSALSEGVHEHNDQECLELASSVRTVLFEFAERLGQALKEEAELSAAVNRLANKKK